MKSKISILAVSALALSACTSEEVLNDVAATQNVIRFDNVVNKVSRADLDKDNLTKFNVFGYYTTPETDASQISNVAVSVFDDVPVTLNTTKGVWEYDNERAWVPNAHYYFYAYSCGSVTKLNKNYGTFSMDMSDGIAPSSRVLTINGYVCDNTHQHDLIYASNTGAVEGKPFHGIVAQESGNPDVAFQFDHLLSKVNAVISSGLTDDYTLSISNVSLENICNIANYSPNGGWTDQDRKNDARNLVYLYDTENNTDVLPITTSSKLVEGKVVPAKTNYAYVIPHVYKSSEGDVSNSNAVALKFHVEVENKGKIVFTKDMIGTFYPKWQAGFSYTYNVTIKHTDLGLQGIVFTTITNGEGAVVNWAPGDDDSKITLR